MRVLIVGERANSETWRPRPGLQLGSEEHVKLLLSMGAFSNTAAGAPTAKRLTGCGLEWDAGLNLCWPDPAFVPWDAELASQTADAVRRYLYPRLRLAILCGAKVSRAFGYRGPRQPPYAVPGSPIELLVPHPSGLCRAWNSPVTSRGLKRIWDELRSTVLNGASHGDT